MKNVYVVTHTESVHHVEGKVGGWYDTGLTAIGRLQARATADRLAELLGTRVPTLTSSDLLRASETAEIIAERLKCTVRLSPDLREIRYGRAEGKEQRWLDARFVPAPDTDRLDHRSLEGAESKRAFVTRVYRAVDQILADDQQEHVLVSHGYAMTFVVSRWIGMPLDDAGFVNFASSPGGITHLQEDDFFRNRAVRFLNCTAHLDATSPE